MKLRWWLERGAIVAAVLATMATSRPGWHIQATIPPSDTTKARVLVVEASQQAFVTVRPGSGTGRTVTPLAPATWPGTARYLIPPGHAIERVEISDKCRGGCREKCEPGAEAFVRVTAIEPAHAWRLEARSEEVTTTITNPMPTYSRFPLTATHEVRVELVGTASASAYAQQGYVQVHQWSEQPRTETWSVRAISEGLCPGNAPCDPPADSKLELGKEEIVAIPTY